jgi:hypothetical protein
MLFATQYVKYGHNGMINKVLIVILVKEFNKIVALTVLSDFIYFCIYMIVLVYMVHLVYSNESQHSNYQDL